MKMSNKTWFIVGFAVALILPGLAVGDYYGNSDYKENFDRAFPGAKKSVNALSDIELSDTEKESQGASLEDFYKKVEEFGKSVDHVVETSAKEKELHNEVSNLSKENTGFSAGIQSSKLFMKERLEDKKNKNDALGDKVSSIASQAQSGSMGMDKNLPPSCENGGVNGLLSGVESVGNLMQQQPVAFIQQQLSDVIEKKDEDLKKKLLSQIAGLHEGYKKRKKPDNKGKENHLSADVKPEARIAYLENQKKKKEKQNDDLFDKLVSAIFKVLIPGLLDFNDDRSAMQKLASQAVQSFNSFLDSMQKQGEQAMAQLESNCQGNSDSLGVNTASLNGAGSFAQGQTSADNFARSWTLKHFQTNDARPLESRDKVKGLAKAQEWLEEVGQTKCPTGKVSEVTGQIDQLRAQVAALGQMSDPQQFMDSITQTVATMSSVKSGMAAPFNDVIKICRVFDEKIQEGNRFNKGVSQDQLASAEKKGSDSRKNAGKRSSKSRSASRGAGSTHKR